MTTHTRVVPPLLLFTVLLTVPLYADERRGPDRLDFRGPDGTRQWQLRRREPLPGQWDLFGPGGERLGYGRERHGVIELFDRKGERLGTIEVPRERRR